MNKERTSSSKTSRNLLRLSAGSAILLLAGTLVGALVNQRAIASEQAVQIKEMKERYASLRIDLNYEGKLSQLLRVFLDKHFSQFSSELNHVPQYTNDETILRIVEQYRQDVDPNLEKFDGTQPTYPEMVASLREQLQQCEEKCARLEQELKGSGNETSN